ncbi:MFS transporter [Arsenicicoccus dermatophilus]|uniref:MFS transporter n=1 Tax=Arsenicicoccus dermatophilus TaxID=1076331 RepID=UPI001F4CD316|nr:MFS transporter [Arsenicicoccus dermatophilus]
MSTHPRTDASPHDDPTPGPLAPTYRLVTLIMLAQVTLVAFESMAVTTAMPAVARELDAVRSYGLVFSLFLSAQLLGTVLAGTWCDLRGPLPVTLVGQAGLALGSALAGVSTSFPMLLAGRVVAGFGGGLLVVALYVVIGRAYPESLRPQVFGWVSAAWVLPSIIGPLLAAWLTESLSWRWVFLVCVPPVLVTAALTWARRRVVAPPGHVGSGRDRAEHRRSAVAGMLVALGAGALQWGSQHVEPLEALPLAVGALGLLVVAGFAPRLVPPGTLRLARGLPSVTMARFLLTAGFNGAITFVPLMLVAERGASATTAGVMMTLGSLGWSLGAALQGREGFVRDRYRLLGLGGIALAAGLVGLALVAGLGLTPWLVPVAVTGMGLGMGLAMSTISVLGLDLTPVADHGQTSASLQLADTLGSALGVAVTGAVFAGLHRGAGLDARAYVALWSVCAASGLLVVAAGRRARPAA